LEKDKNNYPNAICILHFATSFARIKNENDCNRFLSHFSTHLPLPPH
jgi:hypothetical protein